MSEEKDKIIVSEYYIASSCYICGSCKIYNSESQYIRFNDEFEKIPLVFINIIAKPNCNGTIYVSRVDEFGFEIRSNVDRLYDVASEINYIGFGSLYVSKGDKMHYNTFAKVDKVTGEVLGLSIRQLPGFLPFTSEAAELSRHNPKLIVDPQYIKYSDDNIIQAEYLVTRTPSVESVRLSTKNKLYHEMIGYIEHGIKIDGNIIPFTDKDKISLLEVLTINDGGTVTFSNGFSISLTKYMGKRYYIDLLRYKEYVTKKYIECCEKIDNMTDIDAIKEVSLDEVL